MRLRFSVLLRAHSSHNVAIPQVGKGHSHYTQFLKSEKDTWTILTSMQNVLLQHKTEDGPDALSQMVGWTTRGQFWIRNDCNSFDSLHSK